MNLAAPTGLPEPDWIDAAPLAVDDGGLSGELVGNAGVLVRELEPRDDNLDYRTTDFRIERSPWEIEPATDQ